MTLLLPENENQLKDKLDFFGFIFCNTLLYRSRRINKYIYNHFCKTSIKLEAVIKYNKNHPTLTLLKIYEFLVNKNYDNVENNGMHNHLAFAIHTN